MAEIRSIYKDYPPFLNKNQQDFLISELMDYIEVHGINIRITNLEQDKKPIFIHKNVPLTLYPSLFPSIAFKKAKAIQCDFNKLYAHIANDEEFMCQIMENLINIDEFIRKLWDIHLQTKKKGIVQPISLGIFRSDYLLEATQNSSPQLKQVEFNTIASSMGSFSSKISEMHKYLNSIGAYGSCILKEENFPKNDSIKLLSEGLANADRLYGGKDTKILFVVEAHDPFILDQRCLEYELFQVHGIQAYRVSLHSILDSIELRQNDKALLFKSPNSKIEEISVVYFRTGYSPSHYPTSIQWSARLLIEESRAIKCPTVITQLAGCKKVQQVLCENNIINKFLPENISKSLKETFVSIYPLNKSLSGQEAYHLLMNNPQNYVLKPQREGGGNNIYGLNILSFLETISESQREQYILMEMIHPFLQTNTIVQNNELYHTNVVNELGIYGVILWDRNGKIYHNIESGYLLRTKDKDKNEGGVMIGCSSIDSCVLIP
ncbi:glutathione synthetase [Pneumocystis carinii B80]|uniref:Glutathione synthetase n=1 Tax=Pneumocystis carinii (strain B80) TaxID=1408658 RepID=A0A0W4ZT33_PNEC8|nr:glutathione synthetase [Pneumocystis carinii B80]KTW31533.1 glutathione synthetase [Pneumocystis carinii B80]